MAPHRIGVPPRLSVLDVGSRGLRHQGPETLVIGLVGQVAQLLVDDLELFAKTAKANPDFPQATFDHALTHAGSVRTRSDATGEHVGRCSDAGTANRQVCVPRVGFEPTPYGV